MKSFINWFMGLLLMILPAWYHSMKDKPPLPPGLKIEETVKNGAVSKVAVAETEAAAGKGLGARMIGNKGLLTGAGIAVTAAVMFWPEISDAIKSPAQHNQETQKTTAPKSVRRSEQESSDRQVRQARDVTETDDEEISRRKNYQPPDSWKWPYEAQQNVVCEWIQTSPDWEENICHTNFERPPPNFPGYHPRPHDYRLGPQSDRQQKQRGQQPQFVRYGPNVTACKHHGGCPHNGG